MEGDPRRSRPGDPHGSSRAPPADCPRTSAPLALGVPHSVPDPELPFEIRASPIHGAGAFATRHIPEGTRLIEYRGERLTPEQADARYPDVPGETHHTYLFAIDDDIV